MNSHEPASTGAGGSSGSWRAGGFGFLTLTVRPCRGADFFVRCFRGGMISSRKARPFPCRSVDSTRALAARMGGQARHGATTWRRASQADSTAPLSANALQKQSVRSGKTAAPTDETDGQQGNVGRQEREMNGQHRKTRSQGREMGSQHRKTRGQRRGMGGQGGKSLGARCKVSGQGSRTGRTEREANGQGGQARGARSEARGTDAALAVES